MWNNLFRQAENVTLQGQHSNVYKLPAVHQKSWIHLHTCWEDPNKHSMMGRIWFEGDFRKYRIWLFIADLLHCQIKGYEDVLNKDWRFKIPEEMHHELMCSK